MAEYRALAQNTYKFVMETILNTPMDITDPRRAIIPQLKVIVDDATIEYHTPFGAKYNYSTSEGFSSSADKGTSAGVAKSSLHNDYGTPHLYPDNSCIVDGVEYRGLRNSVFTLFYGNYSASKGSSIEAIPKRMLPACVIKVVKYNSTAGTIITETINAAEYTANGIASVTSTSSNYPYAFSHILLRIPKTSDDIILGMEIEYPKYDITFSGTGLQYSVDDGVTFQDVTAGLALEQVEHIILKNTDTVTHNIGTTNGGTDVANIASGATYVAVPTADGTWYIS